MAIQTLYLPKMGESIVEAVVLNWLIQEGEAVTEGDPLLEVATDKVDAEIPAACSGIIQKLLVKKGAVVAIGSAIALLETTDAQSTGPDSFTTYPSLLASPSSQQLGVTNVLLPPTQQARLTPLVKHMAKVHAIPIEELEKLIGQTKDKRITKKILLAYLPKRSTCSTASSPSCLFHEAIIPLPGDEVMPMDRIRRLIADRMVQSKKVAPHVTSFIRADVTAMVSWKKQHQAAFQQKYGLKLTYSPVFMAAVARTLQTFPLLNAVVSDYKVIQRKQINIGFAVALPDGHLFVPVVKKANTLDFITLAQQIDTLIKKARNGSITAEELTGASYTLSNIGSFENLMGTPIIVQPQVAILATGAIERRPAVVYTAGKETIAIRDELFLSHTYDHRIIDGAIGGGFLQSLKKELQILPMLEW
ncbi:dihydrolipoamide acetyltransferase family protein [Candidatus Cardinium hertigii]|uniref:Dihydrolipoamide acetyltransferase component of pyruvate dehydrogenase complex n=1 Tax=Candidatus Cardinium hertigii TaxID=247481 RepID=A0A2Z3L9L6_9BACT|nr:dihydrolipoamide acetyltransferase family protein [Candidatus Cardinium hertigii]AWN82061.1 Dihydrolipoyllysine-residue acetyltransferase component of pyruvate dehydrogenase complex [Candidatus Cardinium hertigii]